MEKKEICMGQPVRDRAYWLSKLQWAIAVAFGIFELWANSIGMIPSMKQAGVFVAFCLCLVYLKYPTLPKGEPGRWYDLLLALLGAIGGLYIVWRTDDFLLSGMSPLPFDILVGTITIILVLEATRRAVGIWLTIIPLAFIAYALLGHMIPGRLGHAGFTFERFIIRMYMVDEGIFGLTVNTAATYIFMFIMFGVFLEQSGIADFFNKAAFAISGWSYGGPAKVSIFASGMLGTISGSAVSNVATTGAFTIPLMKKCGFSPDFAGGVEAAASTGGLLAPPIMGSAAFLMAEFLGVDYSRVILAGIIPAILYYLGIFATVHLEAHRLGLKGLPRDQLPPLRDVAKQCYLLLPLVIIVIAMVNGMTALFAANIGIISAILLGALKKETRISLKRFFAAMANSANEALSVGIACAAAGLIVGVVTMTGVGQVVTYSLIALSADYLLLALAFIALAVIFLSMGLPATAAYIVVVTVAAPALIEMGVAPLAAHFFVFYFSSLSNLTPPVALASYTAAGLSGGKPSTVAWTGLMLTLSGFIIPFIFVYNPQILFVDARFPDIIISLITACIGVTMLSVFVIGHLFETKVNWFCRIAFLIGGLLMIDPGFITDLIGILILITLIAIQFYAKKKKTHLAS